MKTLLLIDGSGIMYRAFYALPEFLSKKGIPTNAIYGTFTMLHKMMADFTPEYIVFCMDTPTQTFRKKLFKEYQSHRPEIAEGFAVQIPHIKTMLDKAGISRVEAPGYEADDVIGTLAAKYKNDYRVLILSSDKDILQLVDTNVNVVAPKVGISTTMIYKIPDVVTKMGVPPDQIPDLKGLMGDPSDNYKGAKGIGPKTATKLLTEYKTIENMFKNIENNPNQKLKESLLSSREDILMSKRLATILTDVPLDFKIENARFTGYKDELRLMLEDYGMNSLLERLFNIQRKVVKKEAKKEEKKADKTQTSLF